MLSGACWFDFSATIDADVSVDTQWDFGVSADVEEGHGIVEKRQSQSKPSICAPEIGRNEIKRIGSKSLGRNVAFEDEFEAAFPEEKYDDCVPLGKEFLVKFMIPAFTNQKGFDTAKGESEQLDKISTSLYEISEKFPAIGENACRFFLRGILNCAKSTTKEFVSSISSTSPENELDLEEFKLNHRISNEDEGEESVFLGDYQTAKSGIAQQLLARWINRC